MRRRVTSLRPATYYYAAPASLHGRQKPDQTPARAVCYAGGQEVKQPLLPLPGVWLRTEGMLGNLMIGLRQNF